MCIEGEEVINLRKKSMIYDLNKTKPVMNWKEKDNESQEAVYHSDRINHLGGACITGPG